MSDFELNLSLKGCKKSFNLYIWCLSKLRAYWVQKKLLLMDFLGNQSDICWYDENIFVSTWPWINGSEFLIEKLYYRKQRKLLVFLIGFHVNKHAQLLFHEDLFLYSSNYDFITIFFMKGYCNGMNIIHSWRQKRNLFCYHNNVFSFFH